jgi:hypothetical protein
VNRLHDSSPDSSPWTALVSARGTGFRGQGAALKDSPPIESVLRWLRSREESDEEWLVVIDNADDSSWNLEAIILQGLRDNVIITSQHPQSRRLLRGAIRTAACGHDRRGEVVSLLLKHADTDGVSVTAEVQETARKNCRAPGWIGAYISE